MKIKRFDSTDKNVFKYVFEFENAIAETVLYRYESFYDRTVICCSVQSGCHVGCLFCGTGKRFIRNLNSEEIVKQIDTVLENHKIKTTKIHKFQIMFMSMGEPMLNFNEVQNSIKTLHKKYKNADLLLSTIGINSDTVFNKILKISKKIKNIGLQFSIHKSNNTDRNKLIPLKNKFSLEKIRDAGILWWKETGRKPYLNYCIDGTNNTAIDFKNLSHLFSPMIFNFTFSVICSPDENMKDKGFKNLNIINEFTKMFLSSGYNVRIFNPAGQDDIGGGCGQLWYVQNWIKNNTK